MVKLVVGSKGKGKTKYMHDTANNEARTSDGLVIYLDKNAKHMFEIDKHIRLINVKEYPVTDFNTLLGFVCGLVAGNSDIEAIYFDSFLTLAGIEAADIEAPIEALKEQSEHLKVDFILSLSMDEAALNGKFKENILVSL